MDNIMTMITDKKREVTLQLLPIDVSAIFRNVSGLQDKTRRRLDSINRWLERSSDGSLLSRLDDVGMVVSRLFYMLKEYDPQVHAAPPKKELIKYADEVIARLEPFKKLFNVDGYNYGDKVAIWIRQLELERDDVASNRTLQPKRDRDGYPKVRHEDVFQPH